MMATVAWVASMIVLSALLAGRVGWTLHRLIVGLKREIERLNQETAQELVKVDPRVPKKGRGRRDAFNEILLGLEERARQVQADRDNLEHLVEQRTLALQRRNEAMRLVLDNVEQGLATIELDGQLSTERSRRFDEWFGPGALPGQKLAIVAAVESHPSGVDKLPAIHREELAHLRIDVVCLDREAAFGEIARVDSGSRSEVEQPGARRR